MSPLKINLLVKKRNSKIRSPYMPNAIGPQQGGCAVALNGHSLLCPNSGHPHFPGIRTCQVMSGYQYQEEPQTPIRGFPLFIPTSGLNQLN